MDDRFVRAWTEGVAPQLSTRALECLLEGLRADSPELLQKKTCVPHPYYAKLQNPICAACVLAYGSWKAGLFATVEQAEGELLRIEQATKKIGAPLAVYDILYVWDNTPRAEAIAALLPLAEQSLREREGTV